MRSRRPRHGLLVLLLLTVGFLATLGGAGARWIDDQLLSTASWTATSGRLIQEPSVREAVADYTVREAFTAGHVPEVLEGLRAPARGVEERFLASAAGRATWRRANREAQMSLLAALRAGARPRPVTLKLGPLLVDALGRLARVPGLGQLGAHLPDGGGRLVILRAAQVRPLRGVPQVIRIAAWALWAVAAAGFLLALLAGAGARRTVFSRIGYRIVVAGGIVLLLRLIAQEALPAILVGGAGDRAAIRAAWLIGSSTLRIEALKLLVAGGVVTVGSWLARAFAR